MDIEAVNEKEPKKNKTGLYIAFFFHSLIFSASMGIALLFDISWIKIIIGGGVLNIVESVVAVISTFISILSFIVLRELHVSIYPKPRKKENKGEYKGIKIITVFYVVINTFCSFAVTYLFIMLTSQ